jgi:hypothetical protein
MEDHINVVLYSKFSQACTKFIEMMEKVPKFKQHTTMVCIDNADIRKRILTGKKLSIKQVPSLIRLYQKNGYAEAFEGERAFSVLNAHYIEHLQAIAEQSFQPPQPPQHPQHPQHPQPPQPPPQLQKVAQSQNVPAQPQNMGMSGTNMGSALTSSVAANAPQQGQTSLDNLMDLTEINEVDANDNGNALNTYHHVAPTQNMPTVDRAVKNTTANGGNIVSRAMQMQKERESETTSNAPKLPLS